MEELQPQDCYGSYLCLGLKVTGSNNKQYTVAFSNSEVTFVGTGNVTQSAEFNFHTDPEAAKVTLEELGCHITLATWELCVKHAFSWVGTAHFTIPLCVNTAGSVPSLVDPDSSSLLLMPCCFCLLWLPVCTQCADPVPWDPTFCFPEHFKTLFTCVAPLLSRQDSILYVELAATKPRRLYHLFPSSDLKLNLLSACVLIGPLCRFSGKNLQIHGTWCYVTLC